MRTILALSIAISTACVGQPYQPPQPDGGISDAPSPCGPRCTNGMLCCEEPIGRGTLWFCHEPINDRAACGGCGIVCAAGEDCVSSRCE